MSKTHAFSIDGARLKRGCTVPSAVVLGPDDRALAKQPDEWRWIARIAQPAGLINAINCRS